MRKGTASWIGVEDAIKRVFVESNLTQMITSDSQRKREHVLAESEALVIEIYEALRSYSPKFGSVSTLQPAHYFTCDEAATQPDSPKRFRR